MQRHKGPTSLPLSAPKITVVLCFLVFFLCLIQQPHISGLTSQTAWRSCCWSDMCSFTNEQNRIAFYCHFTCKTKSWMISVLFRCGRPGAEGEGESSSRSGRGQKVSEHGGDHDYYLFFVFFFLEVNSVSYCTVKKSTLWADTGSQVIFGAINQTNWEKIWSVFLQLYVNRLIISKKKKSPAPKQGRHFF